MIRNTWRSGDYLMRDDESGLVHYRSEMVQRWDGMWVRKDQYETRQPQEFVRAKRDPRALKEIRVDAPAAVPVIDNQLYVGNTTIPVPRGAAWHLFQTGIGSMTIGKDFVVR